MGTDEHDMFAQQGSWALPDCISSLMRGSSEVFYTDIILVVSLTLITLKMLAFVRRCMLSCSKLGSGCHQPCAWGNTTPAIGDPTVELETAQLEKELEAEYYEVFP